MIENTNTQQVTNEIPDYFGVTFAVCQIGKMDERLKNIPMWSIARCAM